MIRLLCWAAALISWWMIVDPEVCAGEEDVSSIEIKATQTAVLDPAKWSETFLGERYFDAIRPLLARFPGLSEAIAAKAKDGFALEKLELLLEWEKQEAAFPERGRSGWGAEEEYQKKPGKWSALCRPLLKPWNAADPDIAPTADCYVKGVGYWAHCAARGDGQDRFAKVFGPVPLHAESPVGRIDLTPLLAERDYAPTPAAALRMLEERGLQIHKLELFDPQYNRQEGEWYDSYCWASGVGYMKIWVKEPKLVATLKREAKATPLGELPPALDFAQLVAQLRQKPDGRSSMAPPTDWAEKIKILSTKPADMPDWQWKRIQELHQLGGWRLGCVDVRPLFAQDAAEYAKIGEYLKVWPRFWDGHLTSDYALLPAALPELLPPALMDHLKLYWAAWLHPETEDIENPRQRSYFRSYNWSLGTMNFNCNSIAGGYLGSQLLGAHHPLRDAKYGLENIVLRNWMFYNGANQEVGDTYYQAISVAAVQMLAKYAQDPFDRLMARIASERQMEQIVSMYNAHTRRITHPMGRGELKYQCAFQDGPYLALHTLSPKGCLMEMDAKEDSVKYGIRLFGLEGPPARMALLAPWADPHWANAVDEKAAPWQVTARWWHLFPDNSSAAEWHIDFLGQHYTLASRSEDHVPVTHITAQWRRKNAPVDHMEDLSTLHLSFGANARVEQSFGSWGIVHHGNKLIALKALPPKGYLSFPPNPDYAGGWRAKDEERGKDTFNALNASAIIISFGDVSQREVWINDVKANKVSGASSPPIEDPKYQFEQHLRTTGKNSVFAKERDLIAIKDGVTYVGLIPMAINPLPRDQEVEVAYEWPVLYVHAFVYRGAEAIPQERWYGADRKATAGFVVEMGDESEYGSFEKFREHMKTVALKVQWNQEDKHTDLEYRSGDTTLAMGFEPWVMPDWNPFVETAHAPAHRSVNGKWPPLPEGVHRETPWSIQGQTGRLEKNGAVLISETGYRTYLLAEPKSGIVTAYNPIPDPIFWRLDLPGGESVRPDGRVGLLRLQVDIKANAMAVDYRLKPEQKTRADLASALILFGFQGEPKVTLNGTVLPGLKTIPRDGPTAYVIPLTETVDISALPARIGAAEERWAAVRESKAQNSYFHDWYVVGPFPNGGYSQCFFQLKEFGPEKGFDAGAVYVGLKPGEKAPTEAEVRWRALLKPGQPRLSDQPVDLRTVFQPNCGVMAYAAASIVSDKERTVQLLTGGDERLSIWLNGERVVSNRGFRLAYRDQDRVFVKLKKGDNPVVLKFSHGYESWRLYFRVADEWGLPLKGVQYRGPHGLTPVGDLQTEERKEDSHG